MQTIEVAAGVVSDNQGHVLICKRKGELSGLWEFPGGKRETGETFAQCLKRELMEELDLPVTPGDTLCDILHNGEQKRIRLVFVNAVAKSDHTLTLHVHESAEWVCPKDLHRYLFCPADQAFIDKGLLL